MVDLQVFDSNCVIGRQAKPPPGSFYEVERLLEEMKHYGIKESLVFHSLSRDYDPSTGNRKLLEEIRGKNNLHGCWVLLPSHTNEMPEPGTLLREMEDKGIRAVRLFPNRHLFKLDDWSMGDTFAVLEESRVPVFLDFGAQFPFIDNTDWDAVHDLCAKHPRLPVVLVHVGFRTSRVLYPMLKECGNLHIGLSGYWIYRGIEFICNSIEMGARRILFGTNLPFYDPGLTLGMVRYADISLEERKLIAGDNLRNLLNAVKW